MQKYADYKITHDEVKRFVLSLKEGQLAQIHKLLDEPQSLILLKLLTHVVTTERVFATEPSLRYDSKRLRELVEKADLRLAQTVEGAIQSYETFLRSSSSRSPHARSRRTRARRST